MNCRQASRRRRARIGDRARLLDVYGHLLEDNSLSWLALIESALPPAPDRRAKATLCAAVIDGLILEFLNTGDLKRTSEALDLFGSLLSAGTTTPARRPAGRLPRKVRSS